MRCPTEETGIGLRIFAKLLGLWKFLDDLRFHTKNVETHRIEML